MYAPIEGGRLWYEDHGGEGPPVVFIHATAGNSNGWFQQLPAFKEAGFRCITYDLRGSGRSQPEPGKEGYGSVAGDLEALVDYLKLDSFLLVAQAYGGFGALDYAVYRPRQLKALVVTNSMGGISGAGFEDTRARAAGMSLAERELGPEYRANNPEGVRRFLQIEAQNQHSSARQTLRQPMTLESLEAINVPTLIVSSDEDVYAPPPLMSKMAERIPNCSFAVITGAGHSAYWEKPDEWNRLVIDFLKQQA
jgi:3-oxoadipate enol-lactonase